MVEIYKGKDIDDDKISFLKYIASQRYCKRIYYDFSNINNVKDLAYLHGISVNSECLAIGTDWFLCYHEDNDFYVQILEWVAKDNEKKIKQVAEMMQLFKNIFLQNKDKIFVAEMRHDSSYPIYLKMLKKGYFEELYNYCIIDSDAPPGIHKLSQKFNSIEDFLSSDIANNYPQYFKYIIHNIQFIITPNFIKKYYKSEEKSREKVLKK